jgi:hypothetical protein
MMKYYNVQSQQEVKYKYIYMDSLCMIKKIKAYDKYPTASLAAVLDSEWDVLSALH